MKKTKLIYGRKPILDAIGKGIFFERIYIADHIKGEAEKSLRSLCRAHLIPLKVVPDGFFKPYKQVNHQGFVGEISPIQYYQAEVLIEHTYEQGEVPLFVMLDKVTDVRNFGAIARSALAFGAQAMFIPTKHAAPINEASIKTSAGALLDLPIARYQNQVALISLLKNSGIAVYASALDQRATQLPELDLIGPSCLIIGSEEKGVNKELQQLADNTFFIPQSDRIESLNASVAAGVCLYEVARQRRVGSLPI